MSDHVRGTHSWRVDAMTEQIADRLSNIKKNLQNIRKRLKK